MSGTRRRVVALLSGVLAVGAAAPATRGSSAVLVAEGERWWRQSPDPGNPVACATCHWDPALTRGWAAGFPKVKPLPPPHTRVMTLLQANAEAVARHYRLADPRPAATAITAYLTALGADLPVSPGMSPGQPVFPERIRQLESSVQRGRRLFGRRCAACHRVGVVAAALRSFPRLRDGHADSAESFLASHRARAKPLAWNGQAVADLVAYLTSTRAGQPVGLSPAVAAKENR